MRAAFSGDPIRLPAGLRFNSSNPAAFLKTADRAVQRAGAEPHAREDLDIFHNCVAVLIPIGQTCENENSWILHSYYASRNNVPRSSQARQAEDYRILASQCVLSAEILDEQSATQKLS